MTCFFWVTCRVLYNELSSIPEKEEVANARDPEINNLYERDVFALEEVRLTLIHSERNDNT